MGIASGTTHLADISLKLWTGIGRGWTLMRILVGEKAAILETTFLSTI
jgi:hypothetical protein